MNNIFHYIATHLGIGFYFFFLSWCYERQGQRVNFVMREHYDKQKRSNSIYIRVYNLSKLPCNQNIGQVKRHGEI